MLGFGTTAVRNLTNLGRELHRPGGGECCCGIGKKTFMGAFVVPSVRSAMCFWQCLCEPSACCLSWREY